MTTDNIRTSIPVNSIYTLDPRHIGPMAQDFQAAFGVGADDKHIATVDADGVALAAIQGLNEILKEKESRIAALEKRPEKLERLLPRQGGGGQ